MSDSTAPKPTPSDELIASRRRDAYRIVCDHFELQQAQATTAAEDCADILAGKIPLDRFVVVTQNGDVVYVKPAGDSAENAQQMAIAHVRDDIYREWPVAVVDLDCGNTFYPDWQSIKWELPWAQLPVPLLDGTPVDSGAESKDAS